MRFQQKMRHMSGMQPFVCREPSEDQQAAYSERGCEGRGARFAHRCRRSCRRGRFQDHGAPPAFTALHWESAAEPAPAMARCGLCELNCPLSAPRCPQGAYVQARQW